MEIKFNKPNMDGRAHFPEDWDFQRTIPCIDCEKPAFFDSHYTTDLGWCEYVEVCLTHSHNPNRVSFYYECDDGHRFELKANPTCWCGWNQEEEKKEREREWQERKAKMGKIIIPTDVNRWTK